jgi:hypothetical protein
MSYWRISFGRSSTVVLVAAAILCLRPRPAQDLQAKPASTDRPDVAPSSVLDEKRQLTGQDVTGDSLPDAPPAGTTGTRASLGLRDAFGSNRGSTTEPTASTASNDD